MPSLQNLFIVDVNKGNITGCAHAQVTMREVQGGIIASAFFVIFFALSGLLRAVLHYISPITGMRPAPGPVSNAVAPHVLPSRMPKNGACEP